MLHQEYKSKKETLKDKNKVSILDKYGGEKYLESAPRELLQGQTEEYVEYSRTGQVIFGKERVKVRSKYAEDGECSSKLASSGCLTRWIVFINNHGAVWGSWYDLDSGAWGYACCHSNVHASYCAGEAGIEASKASSAAALLSNQPSSSAMPPPPVPAQKQDDDGEADERRRRAESNFSKKRVGEGDVQIDKSRLDRALAEERKRKAAGQDDDSFGMGKRRKGGVGGNSEVTEEELGAFLAFAWWFLDELSDLGWCRGVPNEPEQFRGSDGELQGRGSLMCVRVWSLCTLFVYSTLSHSLLGQRATSLGINRTQHTCFVCLALVS